MWADLKPARGLSIGGGAFYASKQYGGYAGPVMAGAVLQTLPLVLLFILFRRHFLQGMSLTLK